MYIDPLNYLDNLKCSISSENQKNEVYRLFKALKCRLEDFERIYKLKHSNCLSSSVWFLLTDLNLSNLQLEIIPDENVFSSLPNLRRLWLNNNRIENLNNCLTKCEGLLELRLGSNQLYTICGQLYRLHCLEILDLSNNHLGNIQEVEKELSRMHFLRELNLLGNSIVLQPDFKYRLLTILPTITVLNKHEILPGQVHRINSKRNHYLEEHRELNKKKTNTIIQVDVNKEIEKPDIIPVKETESFEENLNKRFQQKCITQFKCLDWSTIPNSETRRLGKEIQPPKNLLIRLQL
uniref:Dynein assembly factor 1, axonemal homolog n=1 Tax=Trichobilharzia regenti TaxID=157069 RepID=A0AA85K1S0_TRIRE|nr:unnamed protein product [Trichobilharzia regenti]